MRLLRFFPLLLSLAAPLQAAPLDPAAQRVFELAGVRLLCQQATALLQHGMPRVQQKQLAQVFAAEPLCADLAMRVAAELPAAQWREALQLLDSPLAKHFTEAERAVGDDGGLAAYRAQLATRPPRAERLQLVRRLDQAAYTSELATVLRYEVGKTQALLALRARGESLDEQALGEQTAAQVAPIRASSASGVESFMLFAYRQSPSAQLADYVALYEQPAVRAVLQASAHQLPKVFAARRAQLR